MLKLDIPVVTPSLNAMLDDSKMWRIRKKPALQKQIAQFIWYDHLDQMREYRARFPLERVRIEIERRQVGRRLDKDNLYGSVKPLIDVLCPPSERNKFGLGIILDDRDEVIEKLTVRSVSCRQGERGMTVIIHA